MGRKLLTPQRITPKHSQANLHGPRESSVLGLWVDSERRGGLANSAGDVCQHSVQACGVWVVAKPSQMG